MPWEGSTCDHSIKATAVNPFAHLPRVCLIGLLGVVSIEITKCLVYWDLVAPNGSNR